MDVSIGTSVAEFVGNFFRGGKATAHVVGAHGRGTRPAVLLAVAAAALIAAATPAHAQMQGGIQIRGDAAMASGYEAQPPVHGSSSSYDDHVVSGGVPIRVKVVTPTRKLGSSTVNAVPIETVFCQAGGSGAVTVIGNAVYCGNRMVSRGDAPDAYIEPGFQVGAVIGPADALAAENHRNLEAARRAVRR